MKLWHVCLLATVCGYNPFGFAPQTTPSGPEVKNFGVANELGGGLLPLGLECKVPTPRGDINKQRFLGESRIVNGTEAGINWPFIVRLKVDGLYQCGGSILNEEWILTAAHCLNRMKFVMITLGDLHRTDIEVGEISLLSTDFFIHPDFDQIKMTNDIALIRMPKAIQFNERMKPVCLAQRPPVVAKECFVAGWGTISAGGMVASRLLEARVPIIHDSKCALAESYGDWFKKDSMICAGKFDAGGTDSCQGDSGGPLICVVGSTPVLTGVVSWGVGCAQKKKPGVYARVHKLRAWIEQSVKLGSAADPAKLNSVSPVKAQTTRYEYQVVQRTNQNCRLRGCLGQGMGEAKEQKESELQEEEES